MRGHLATGNLVCPECGQDALIERRLYKNRRRWWVIVYGAVLIIAVAHPVVTTLGWSWEQWILASLNRSRLTVRSAVRGPDWLTKRLPKSVTKLYERVYYVDTDNATDPFVELCH